MTLMQYSVYSERHIKGRLEAVIDRVLEVFDHHTADAVPSELCTRSEALELQDMTQGLMALLFNDRKVFLNSAEQMRERIDQACELLTRILEGSNMMMKTENGDAVGLPQAVNGLRTTLSGTPVPPLPGTPNEGIAFNLVGLLSGVSWAAPQPVPLLGWFVWDLLWIFEACVSGDVAEPLGAIDAVLVCPVAVVLPPYSYASLAPDAAALACACLFYQASWSRSLSQTIEAFPRHTMEPSYNGTDIRAVQSWHSQHAQDKERLLEAAWRRCGPSVCVPNSLGELISRTAAPWSRTLHRYYPPAARARAIEVLRAGALLANGLEQGTSGLMDIWVELVMPLVLSRFPRGTGMLWDADKGLWRDGSGVMNGSSLYA